jgi:hypothetical protein
VLGPDRSLFLAHYQPALDAGVGIAEVLLLEQGVRWRSLGRFKWQASALLPSSEVSGAVLVLGRDGEIGLIVGDTVTEEARLAASAVGPTRGLVQVAGQTLAFGMKREVFCRRGPSRWVALNDGMNPPLPSGLSMAEAIKFRTRTSGGLNALLSGPDADVYAFGLRGEIWRRTGEAAWNAVDSPTNLALKDAVLAGDGAIYACGQAGILIRGFGDQWGVVNYDGPTGLDFCSVAWFADTLFLADGHSLRRLRAGTLEVVDLGVGAIVPSSQLHAHSGMLLSVAGKEVFMTSDGVQWTSLLT